MFKAISSICTGAALESITGDSTVTTVGTGYVDDVKINVTAKNIEPQEESMIWRKINYIAQKWEE